MVTDWPRVLDTIHSPSVRTPFLSYLAAVDRGSESAYEGSDGLQSPSLRNGDPI